MKLPSNYTFHSHWKPFDLGYFPGKLNFNGRRGKILEENP